MFCRNCGKEISNDTVYCPNCGYQVKKQGGQNGNVNTNTVNSTTTGKKGKKWIWVVLIVIVVAIWGNRCGSDTESEGTGDNNEAGTESQAKTDSNSKSNGAVEDYSDRPVWSKEYLFWYVESSNMNLDSEISTAKDILQKVQKFETTKSLTTESSLFKGTSYAFTVEDSNLIYMGGEKDNKPDGLGIIWKGYEINDEVFAFKAVYAGNFSKGKFDGKGILFKDYDDSIMQDSLDTLNHQFNLTADNARSYCEQYLESISYIGEFDNGEQTGKGVYFQYPNIQLLSYAMSSSNGTDEDATEMLNLNNIDIYQGTFNDGECQGDFKIYHDRYLFYDGEMKNDQMDGKGILYFSDSTQVQYDGHWNSGKYDGKGTLYDENGNEVYKGKWDNGDYAH